MGKNNTYGDFFLDLREYFENPGKIFNDYVEILVKRKEKK